MRKAAIVHGTKGSPSGNWFPWMAAELTKLGFQTYVPTMPTPENQNLGSWLRAFDLQVGELDSESLLIGHSVGAVFALRFLERQRSPIATAVFVAGFTGKLGLDEYDQLNSSFVAAEFDWESIKKGSLRHICFAGDNDPYVPLVQAQEIAEKLGQDLLVLQGGGHLNSEFGYGEFQELLAELK